MHMQSQNIENYFLNLQKHICEALSRFEDTAAFRHDPWSNAGGSGKSCVLAGGKVLDKAGVNFSHVQGASLPAAATAAHPELAEHAFDAMGVSLVIHPVNPYVPTTHANVRFFIATQENGEPVWWFGGGFDLTPYYGFTEDCIHWHQMAHSACLPFGEDVYPHYKKACDEYFYLPHRKETRGIGGLFFDDLGNSDANPVQRIFKNNFEKSLGFMQSVGDHFLKAYVPIVEKRYQMPYGQREREFQLYRRGRYAEFNLLYDRGTRFGLQYGGRTESILMSLPPEVRWIYDWQPEANSAEAKLADYFLKPHDWLAEKIG